MARLHHALHPAAPLLRTARTSSLWAVAVALGVVGVAGAAIAAVDPEAPTPAVPALDWQPCENYPGFDCAVAEVPLDYDDPAGAVTGVALARLPATDLENRIGTVFVNPGGPGGSGVDLVRLGFGAELSADLDGRFDVVGFDPRGIGASNPIQCFATNEERDAYFAGLPIFPYERHQFLPYYRAYAGLAGECADGALAGDGGAEIARAMSTADVARDLDLLRQAVGDDALTYLGFSYGSYLGNTYANLFPDKVRALVIDGVLDPRLWASGWQIRSDRVATAEEFAEFLRLCDEAAEDCAFATPEGSAARWAALTKALRAEPYSSPELTYTYDFLVADAAAAMYAPEYWGGPDGWGAYFDSLADLVLGAAVLDGSTAADLRDSLYAQLVAPTDAADDYQNGLEAYYGNQCADTQYPKDFISFQTINEYAVEGSQFGPYWWWSNTGCTHWPVAEDRYTGPWTAQTSFPVLVVGNYYDGVTDYDGAVASAHLLDGVLLSYAGWGHTAYGRSACATEHVDSYLLDQTLPPERTVCPANPNPFIVAVSEASAPLVGLPQPWLLSGAVVGR